MTAEQASSARPSAAVHRVVPIPNFAIYGLSLQANLSLPGLRLSSESRDADVRVRLKEGQFPPFAESKNPGDVYVSPNLDERGRPVVRICKSADGAQFGFFYSDGASFIVEKMGREIWADWPNENYTLEDAATYLIGPVIGFVLRLRGLLPLHASAISMDGRAIAVAGGPGAGKSTTAAAFARMGYAIISEDLAALRETGGRFIAEPGYPRINLWPDSVQNLFGSENALLRISPTWDKRFVALDDAEMRFEDRALPIGAIYILGDREMDSREAIVTELDGPEALLKLVANTYVNYLLDAEMRRAEFDALGRMLKNVAVREAHPPAEPSRIAELCDAILLDARKLPQPASASAQRGSA